MMLGNYTGTSAVSYCEGVCGGGAVGGKAGVLGVGGRVADECVLFAQS